MNSLEDLNNLSQTTTFTHEDDRDPQLVFDRENASNTTVTVNEGISHQVPVTIEVIEVINYDDMTSFYEIDISELTGAILTWPTLPAYMTATTPSTGVYRLTGFRTANDWNQVKRPLISLPNALSGEFDYTVDIGYIVDGETTTKSFTVGLTVNDLDLWTSTSDFFWNISTAQIITGTPTVVDDGISTPTYTITITPSSGTSINSMSSTGIGGSSNFNSGSKVFSIAGTQEQVNSHLENITLTSNATEENFTFTYVILTSLGETDTVTQAMKCQQIRYLGVITTPTVQYDEDTSGSVSGGPQITDIDTDGSGTYVLNITGVGVKTLSATGSGGGTSFNAGTRTLSIFGTRTEVNSYIDNITLFPKADFASNFTLTYSLTTPTAATQSKSQLMQIDALDPEVNGIDGVSRYFAKNTATFIFGNTTYIDTSSNTQTLSQTAPQIIDLDPEPATYSVTLACNTAVFSTDGKSESTSVTITGTKSQVNTQIAGVRFYAQKNTLANNTITWTQLKNGSSHYSNSFVVEGIDTGGTTFATDFVITSTQNWVPDIDSRRYSTNADIMIMGGGGAGAYKAGGGGGGVRLLTNSTAVSSAFYSTYPITIGAGGTPVFGRDLDAAAASTKRGGSTTAFGFTATGGEGGAWFDTTSNDDYVFVGGASGNYNGSAGNTAFTSQVFNLSNVQNDTLAGPGGASIAQSDYDSNWIRTGKNSFYVSGQGWKGGAGSNGIEFPTGSKNWYGGGGGGGGGVNENALTFNRGPAFFDSVGYSADGSPFPIPIKYLGGGGDGRSTNDDPNIYNNRTPPIPTVIQNGLPNRGGGGGGGATEVGASDRRPGFGGSGVVVIRYNT